MTLRLLARFGKRAYSWELKEPRKTRRQAREGALDESACCGRQSRVALTPRRWRQVGADAITLQLLANPAGRQIRPLAKFVIWYNQFAKQNH
jgi:hypothetical protein